VVGSTVRLDGEPYEVVGVLPEGFDDPFVAGVELWKPPHVEIADAEVRGWRGFRAIGRLASGASLAAAEAELSERYRVLASTHPEIDAEWRLRVQSLQRIVVGDSRLVLLAFLWGAVLLLVIVCANVANLLLARGIARRSELAMRTALGASRARLVYQILAESLVLALAAGTLALLLARGASTVLLSLAPADIPRLGEVAMGWRVLFFAALASLAVTALFALAPALRVTSWNLSQTLRSSARGGEELAASRLRGGLLVAELALSMVLLTSAGLLATSFTRYLAWEPGFDPGSVLAVSVFVDLGKHPTRAQFTDVLRRGEERVAVIPGVEGVATASAGPLFGGGDGATPFETDDRVPSDGSRSAWWFDVGPAFFATLGVPVVQGREFGEEDAPGATPVAVVNETFVRMAWPDGRAVGRAVRLPDQALTLRVVGVVADVPPLEPGQPIHPEIYWSNRQNGRPASFLLVRTSADPEAVASAVTDALLEVDPDFSLGAPFTLAASRDRSLVRPRFQALVMTTLGLVALALSAAGVYAVVSYAVARRMHELGTRRALGATSARIVSLVVASSVAQALLGVGLGSIGALGSARLLEGMIAGVSGTEITSLLGAGAALLGSAAMAAAIPALRATRADPLAAMRE
jgi:predicted permease